MNARLNDVLVHINETLDDEALHRLEEGIRHDAGVISVGHRPEKTHMIMVVYDTDATRASSLLHRFQERGLHAQVVVADGVGWVFYFTHPDRYRLDASAANLRRSTIQVAALVPDGDGLRCIRDLTVDVDLSAAEPPASAATSPPM